VISVNKLFFIFLVWCTTLVGVTSDEVLSSIQERFENQLRAHWPGIVTENITVKILNYLDIEDSISSDVYYTQLDLPEQIDVIGRTVRPLELYSKDNELLDKIPVVVSAKARNRYYKASKRIYKGDIIRESDIRSEVMDMHGKPKRSVFNRDDIVGQQADSVISKGTVITSWMVRPIPTILEGDKITVFLVGENLELKIKGIALDDGYLGESIRVKSDVHKKKTLKGEIIDSSTVKVFFIN